jgi:hypothetical protein
MEDIAAEINLGLSVRANSVWSLCRFDRIRTLFLLEDDWQKHHEV